MTTTELRVVPRPRRVDETGESVPFNAPLVIDSPEAVPEAVVSLFDELLERETNEPPVQASDEGTEGESPDVRLTLEDRPSEEFDDPE